MDYAIAEFGRRMGIDSLALQNGNLLALDVESVGRLHLEKVPATASSEAQLLMYLATPYPAYDTTLHERILRFCHYRHGHPLPVSGSEHDGQAILLVRLPQREATAAMLENTALFLAQSMELVLRG